MVSILIPLDPSETIDAPTASPPAALFQPLRFPSEQSDGPPSYLHGCIVDTPTDGVRFVASPILPQCVFPVTGDPRRPGHLKLLDGESFFYPVEHDDYECLGTCGCADGHRRGDIMVRRATELGFSVLVVEHSPSFRSFRLNSIAIVKAGPGFRRLVKRYLELSPRTTVLQLYHDVFPGFPRRLQFVL